jgi:hypothetical protein
MRKILILALLLLLIPDANANPIVINYSHDFLWFSSVYGMTPIWIPIATSLFALMLEFIALKLLVGTRMSKISNVGRKFVIINSVTFPATQVVAFWLGPVSEFLPIVAEKLFYNRDNQFKAWGYKGWLVVIGVNLLSYLAGIVFSEIYLRVAYA